MSVNKYDSTTQTLTTLASGSRVWTGTKAAYDAQKAAGTLPTNAIICITDDEIDSSHYSTDETFTGMYWIDGKPIYRKVIDFGSLPNNTEKRIAHGISNLDHIIKLYGISWEGTQTVVRPIPYVNTQNSAQIQLWGDSSNKLCIRTDVSFSSTSQVYVIVEYTKTTD